MSPVTLYRWSGVILLIATLVGIIGTILDSIAFPGHVVTVQQALTSTWAVDASLFLIWSLLLVMSLPGFYLRQATRARTMGFVGFVLLSLGLLLGGAGFGNVQVTIFPYLAQFAPKLFPGAGAGPDAGFLLWILGPDVLLAIGSILLGIATMRSQVFPRWTGILLIVAGVLFLLSIPSIPAPVGDIIDIANNVTFFVALGWGGYVLVGSRKEQVGIPFAPAEAQISR